MKKLKHMNIAHGFKFSLRLVDQFLLCNYPFVWRCKPFLAVTLGLFFCGAGFLLGKMTPTDPRFTWGSSQITAASTSFLIVVFIGGALWARSQLRYRLDQQSPRRHFYILIANSLLLLLIFPGHCLFDMLVSSRVAVAISYSDFQEKYAYHSKWDFWTCTEKIDNTTISRELPKLQEELAIFGFSTTGKIIMSSDPNCNTPNHWNRDSLLIVSSFDKRPVADIDSLDSRRTLNNTFKDRLFAIQYNQSLHSTPTLQRLAHFARPALLASMTLAFTILFCSIAHPQWERIFNFEKIHRMFYKIKIPVSPALEKYEEKLLLHNPNNWAFLGHRIILRFLVYAIVAHIIYPLAKIAYQDFLIYTLMGFQAHNTIALSIRFHAYKLEFYRPQHWIRWVAVSLWHQLPMIVATGIIIGYDKDISKQELWKSIIFGTTMVFVVFAFPLTVAGTLFNFLSMPRAFLMCSLYVAGLLYAFNFSSSQSMPLIFIWAFVAAAPWYFTLRNKSPKLNITSWLAALAIVLGQIAAITAAILFNFKDEKTIILLIILVISMHIFGGFAPHWVLAKYRYEPQKQT